MQNAYTAARSAFAAHVRARESFDIVQKPVRLAEGELTVFYVQGLIKDALVQNLLTYFLSLKSPPRGALAFARAAMPAAECRLTRSAEEAARLLFSGALVVFGSAFGARALAVDVRNYPARSPSEPENDRVMRGARDGFVETLIVNTALIRRRIRSGELTVRTVPVGSVSKTDVAVCYMEGRADPALVCDLLARLRQLRVDALPMGHQSLAESLVRKRWYNPFPKFRYTERPDAAAAELLEGSVILLVDTSPAAMILPTSVFDFLQQTNDYYLSPLTGSYLRLVRHVVFWLTMILTPLWYLAVKNPAVLPPWLTFVLPEKTGALPLLLQLLLTEFIIDGLRMASMNTPDMLTNSLSVVGGLILGDFAVSVGWLIPEVILYMAFVAISNFTQTSFELGYALKFMRILLLVAVALFNYWGFFAGLAVAVVLIATNNTVGGRRGYLYPLFPFSRRALKAVWLRLKKRT